MLHGMVEKFRVRSMDGFVKSTAILFLSSQVGNVANYLYQFFMGRSLSPSDYGALNALLSVFMVTAVPAGTILTVTARHVSQYKAENDDNKIADLLQWAWKHMLPIAALCVLAFASLSPMLSRFLQIPSKTPILIIGALLALSLLAPLNLGALQGLQAFGQLGMNIGLGGLLRLTFGVLLVFMGFGLNGALFATLLAVLTVLAVSFLPLKRFFSSSTERPQRARGGEILYGSLPVMFGYLCFMVLTNADLILVKHYFSPAEAGEYAAAAVLGRIVLFLPGAITIAIFPIVSELHTLNQDPLGILKKGLWLTGLLSGVTAGLYLVAPGLPLTILFGPRYHDAAPLLQLFGIAMLPYALINVILHFNLARQRVWFIYSMVGAAAVQIALIATFHTSMRQILYSILGVGTCLFAANLVPLAIEHRQERRAEEGVEVAR